MRMLKWMLIIGGSVVGLVIAALLLIPLFVDVEKYKPEIEKQVSSTVGRPFAIKGPAQVVPFPLGGRGLLRPAPGIPSRVQGAGFPPCEVL